MYIYLQKSLIVQKSRWIAWSPSGYKIPLRITYPTDESTAIFDRWSVRRNRRGDRWITAVCATEFVYAR